MTDLATIKGIVEASHKTAKEKGWWISAKSIGEQLVLFHAELSEALEEIRNGHKETEIYYGDNGKPEGFPIELADVIIRIADTCGYYGIDLEDAIRQKMIYNQTRPYRHGGKTL